MVSSAFVDLPEHRALVLSAIFAQQLFPIAMEFDTSVPASIKIEASLEKVQDAFAFVGIIGYRYGEVPVAEANPQGLSLAHLEYREAVRLGLPILIFIMEHPVAVELFDQDPGKRRKLQVFRDEVLKRQFCSFFNSLEEFAAEVALAFARLSGLVEDPAQSETDPEPQPDGVEVGWSADSATAKDLLRRGSLARVLDARLREARETDPRTSLLVHLDGSWGAGKSSVLMLLAEYLIKKPPFLIVWFDAWQQSRVSPPWWALLTTLRQHVLADLNPFSRAWVRAREMWARMRVSGAPYTVALVLLVVLSAGLGYATWWLANRFTPTTGDLIKLFTPAIAMVTFLWAGSRVASRVLLWASAGGARLFEQSNSNPMARVALHFDWLLKQSKKPVAFFIDDLDRCREDYVVEFLDSVHTLVRDAARSHHCADPKRSAPAAYFVVAADGAWIRQSYEHAYQTFGEPIAASGGSLGYLFLDKLFQLNVPMPALGGRAQREFMGKLLGIEADGSTEQVASASAAIKEAAGDEAAIIDALGDMSPGAREAVAGEAALALATSETRKHTEHTLRKFSPMLHGNPRSIKLFLNTYSMLRSVRTLEGSILAPDTLALWALIRVRWPSIADVLQRNPDAVEGIKDDLWCADHFPEDLRTMAKSKDLRRVVLHEPGGPLTADLIRQCCGLAER